MLNRHEAESLNMKQPEDKPIKHGQLDLDTPIHSHDKLKTHWRGNWSHCSEPTHAQGEHADSPEGNKPALDLQHLSPDTSASPGKAWATV